MRKLTIVKKVYKKAYLNERSVKGWAVIHRKSKLLGLLILTGVNSPKLDSFAVFGTRLRALEEARKMGGISQVVPCQITYFRPIKKSKV